MLDEIRAGREEVARLQQLCAEKLPTSMPDLMGLETLLDECIGYFESRFSPRNDAPAHEVDVPARLSEASSPVPGRLQSREQAYRQLREAAAYIRRIEPHSPVPLLV